MLNGRHIFHLPHELICVAYFWFRFWIVYPVRRHFPPWRQIEREPAETYGNRLLDQPPVFKDIRTLLLHVFITDDVSRFHRRQAQDLVPFVTIKFFTQPAFDGFLVIHLI